MRPASLDVPHPHLSLIRAPLQHASLPSLGTLNRWLDDSQRHHTYTVALYANDNSILINVNTRKRMK